MNIDHNTLDVWRNAAADLGLVLKAPFTLQLKSGEKIFAVLLVTNFGAKNGMLIVKDYNVVQRYLNEIKSLGYGFSIFEKHAVKYDREEFIDMLSDWTWSGNESKKPKWLLDRVLAN